MLKRSLFSKIFISIILMSFLVGAFVSAITIRERTQLAEETLVRKSKLLAGVASQITETGYLSAQLPFETLKVISEAEDIAFLWVVKSDGEIYFADKPEMFGKIIQDPSLGTEKMVTKDTVYPKEGEKIKLIIHPLRMELGKKPWSLFLGASLKSVTAAKQRVILTSIGFFLAMILIAVIISFYLAKRVTKPLGQLGRGAVIIGKGNLKHRIKLKTRDEIEELAKSFNQMAKNLGKSRTALEEAKASLEIRVAARTKELQELAESLEDKVKDRTKELQDRVNELEKFHRITIGRELRMIELKKKLQEFKKGRQS